MMEEESGFLSEGNFEDSSHNGLSSMLQQIMNDMNACQISTVIGKVSHDPLAIQWLSVCGNLDDLFDIGRKVVDDDVESKIAFDIKGWIHGSTITLSWILILAMLVKLKFGFHQHGGRKEGGKKRGGGEGK